MKTSPLFAATERQIEMLISRHPFAQLVSVCDGTPICTPLPLLLERNGEEAWLIGHFARSNPQVNMLRQQPRALAIFMGTHGYISPSWMRDRTQAPTWNYATVHLDVEVAFEDDQTAIDLALEKLVSHVENGRPQAWSALDMGERYARLASAVVAFRARVVGTNAKFKLGQNERADVFADIVQGLEATGQSELAALMQSAAG